MEPKKEPVEKPESKKEAKLEAKMELKMPKGAEAEASKSGKKLCPKCNRQMSCNCK